MSRHVAFYHKDTGRISDASFYTSDESLIEKNTPVDHLPIEQPVGGKLDHLSQRVAVETLAEDETATAVHVVDHQPPQPSADHEWNDVTKRWQLHAVAAQRLADARDTHAAIARLEASQHRPVREALLGVAGARERVAAIHAQIELLESKLNP